MKRERSKAPSIITEPKMSRGTQIGWAVFFAILGWFFLEVIGTVALDGRGKIDASPIAETINGLLWCSPGILFASFGIIQFLRALRNK